jgi:SAM-dependent methyltransferase
MKLKDRFIAGVHAQFGRPIGFWGSIAGWIMAVRSSNRKRNVWAVSLLDVRHGDRILEIGFGPGLAIREISRIVLDGYVCGLDHSARMLRQAERRNAAAIRDGRVDLRLGSVDSLAAFYAPFDKILAVNTVMFWNDPEKSFAELRHLLRPEGRIVVAHQPRGPGVTDKTATAAGLKIAAQLARAGFCEVRTETLELSPAVVGIVGIKPPAGPTGVTVGVTRAV